MKINSTLNINDKVVIIPLDYKGFINGIYIDRHGLRYEVKYFLDGEPKFHYFEESELEKLENNNLNLGFARNF